MNYREEEVQKRERTVAKKEYDINSEIQKRFLQEHDVFLQEKSSFYTEKNNFEQRVDDTIESRSIIIKNEIKQRVLKEKVVDILKWNPIRVLSAFFCYSLSITLGVIFFVFAQRLYISYKLQNGFIKPISELKYKAIIGFFNQSYYIFLPLLVIVIGIFLWILYKIEVDYYVKNKVYEHFKNL